VIFIITTPQLSNDLEMNLPSPKKEKALRRRLKSIEFRRFDGQISLNDQPMPCRRSRKRL